MVSLVMALALVPGQAHESANPLYKELLDPGLVIGPDVRAKLPKPLMADGLDANQQTAIIEKLIGGDYAYEEFTRKSVVAPHILKIREVKPADPKAPGRGLDIYFLAYGNLDGTADEAMVERAVNAGREGAPGKGKPLTRDDLARRKISFSAEDEKRERYAFFEGDFLEKVRLKGVGRVMWNKSNDSLLVAAIIDPRFGNDAERPNVWQSIIKADGETKLGPASPYVGAAFYLKATKLAKPEGAMFIEQHVVFAEPLGWFEGAPLLRAKLPIAVQTTVRALRREWQQAK